MLEKIRTIIKQKGQGIVEYALLLAFVVGIGMMLSSSNLGGSLHYLFDDVAFVLEGESDTTYVEYFTDWKRKRTAELENVSNRRRLDADQKALAFIASQFLDTTPARVKELMGIYSNNWGQDWLNTNININYNKVDSEGWSEVLVPLSYKQSNIDDNGYVWLEAKRNIATVNALTENGATTLENQTSFTNAWGENHTGDKKSVSLDRLFYSNDMVNHNGVAANDRIGVHADANYQEQHTTLDKNTTLFLYTDGLTEAENKRKQQWGMKHLDAQLSSSRRMNPDNLLNSIEKAIINYAEGTALPDDITMLAIQYMSNE